MPEKTQDPPATCPVDHKSRDAWLEHTRAAANATGSDASPNLPPSHPVIPANMEEKCPVDHKAREAWVQHAGIANGGDKPIVSNTTVSQSPPSNSWASSLWSYVPFASSTTSQSSPGSSEAQSRPRGGPLSNDRVVSSIPRTSILDSSDIISTSSPSSNAAAAPSYQKGPQSRHPHSTSHANAEQETGADPMTGNWIYPSERMFFEAMKRKGHDARVADMATVVPIHNAVNERAWAEIKEWEAPYYQSSPSSSSVSKAQCDGPRLHSFSGLSTKMTPKARILSLLGYQAPFDRHDWVVDRCGKEIEYVIDFYAGKSAGVGPKLSFYLDVRPKLNSWEGVKMRVSKGLGFV